MLPCWPSPLPTLPIVPPALFLDPCHPFTWPAFWLQPDCTCPQEQLVEALTELEGNCPLWQAGDETLETTLSQPEPLAASLR